MSTVFADTFYYFAFLNANDELHERARILTEEFDGKMVTTAWVLTELADGMADPENRVGFVAFFEALRNDKQVQIVPANQSLWDEGIALYGARADKKWSLTDCISMVVMEQQRISDVLTGDVHFQQAGFNLLLK